MSLASEHKAFVADTTSIKPTDLRGILKYVPRFQGHTFVIAMDGAIVADENFGNLLVDIAVLRSLGIKIVLVHGIGKQIVDLAREREIQISDHDGTGLTDAKTLDLAIRTSARVSQLILEGLTQGGMKCAITNAVRAIPVGIIHGVDLLFSGKVDRVDQGFLDHLLSANIIPIIQPVGYGPDGGALRINSDLLAAELGEALQASKIIYLTTEQGLKIDGDFRREITADALRTILRREPGRIGEGTRSKAVNALHSLENGVTRVHILDGRIFDGMINEIFSSDGVGTMIYANDYQQIRRATRGDARAIQNLTRNAMRREELLHRTQQAVERAIEEYFVFEVDGIIISCAALHVFPENPKLAEIGSLYVQSQHQGRGIGKKMVDYACMKAKEAGVQTMLALSTQSFSFFTSEAGFEETDTGILPPSRLRQAEASGRHARVLARNL